MKNEVRTIKTAIRRAKSIRRNPKSQESREGVLNYYKCMVRPNIFNIATKELSQDAFITWLLQFADNAYQSIDPLLNKCGKMFVSELIRRQNPKFNETIINVSAGRQWENIDVWAEVNDKYLIIIEDKTFTGQHSNQLSRYKEIAEKWCTDNQREQPICIYLKTGNESLVSLNNIEEQGFSVFTRTDFIAVLEKFEEMNNNIFLDFYERLVKIEELNNEFDKKIINKWNGNDWQGFFQFLEKEIKDLNWFYVNNRQGGFWCAIPKWCNWGEFPVYLQLEQDKLCFKISTDEGDTGRNIEKSKKKEVRSRFYNLIMEKAKELQIEGIAKPNRFAIGTYMTAAVICKENWLGSEQDIINKEDVVKALNKYQNFLEEIIK